MVAIARALTVEVFGLGGLFNEIVETLAIWRARQAQRDEFASVSFREIQEMGIDQAALDDEVAKFPWQA